MNRRLGGTLAASLILASLLPAASSPQKGLTVVELFTSQGCSSCPPANAKLAALAASRRDVVPLSFGVTYWDQLGWKDSFASPTFTRRQRDYAAALGHDNVWTPQMVIDGKVDIVGGNGPQVDAAIARAGPVAGADVASAGSAVTIAAARKRAVPADVWLVFYDPRTLQVPIRAGENSGRTLPHRNVVRALVRLGGWSGDARRFALPAPPPGLQAVVLVQTAKAGAILGVARVNG